MDEPEQPDANGTQSLPPFFMEFFGAPPVLSTEDEAGYFAMMSSLLRQVDPRDVIALMLCKDVCDYRFEIERYRRLKVCIIQITYRRRVRKQVDDVNVKAAEERNLVIAVAGQEEQAAAHTLSSKKDELDKRLADIKKKRDAKLAELERRCVNDVSHLQVRPPADCDLVTELPNWIHSYNQVDALLEIAEKRFVSTLRELERHLGGLGRTLCENLRKTIDGEVVKELV